MTNAKKPDARSPYQKYGKSPFKYEHPSCKHSRTVFQAVPATNQHDGWKGDVCASCNVIIYRYRPDERRDRYAA